MMFSGVRDDEEVGWQRPVAPQLSSNLSMSLWIAIESDALCLFVLPSRKDESLRRIEVGESVPAFRTIHIPYYAVNGESICRERGVGDFTVMRKKN